MSVFTEFPLALMDRLIRKQTKKRVSKNAQVMLGKVLEEFSTEIIRHAIEINTVKGTGKTIRGAEIKVAWNIFKSRGS